MSSKESKEQLIDDQIDSNLTAIIGISVLDYTEKYVDKKDKLINKLKNEAKMADLSNIKNMQKEQLKEYKKMYIK